MGFTVKEINNVVHGTLEKTPDLAEKLVQDLEVRGDVQSLCYIPLVCSIVILVYRKENGQLPATLTQLYEKLFEACCHSRFQHHPEIQLELPLE